MEDLTKMMTDPFNGLKENGCDGFKKKCKEIADILFCNYYIDCNGKKYYFAELEFYYWDMNLLDEKWNRVTYPRISEAGKLFYHLSGVDICFESYYNNKQLNEDARFGGVLIRAIRCNDCIIAGPWNCMLELLNECNGDKMPELKHSKGSCIQKDVIKETYRALGEDDRKEDKKHGLNLCFYDSSIKQWNHTKVRLNKQSGRLQEYQSKYNIERFDLQK